MALKILLLKRSLETKEAELKDLRAKEAEFSKREAELETAINEAETEADLSALEAETNKFNDDKKEYEQNVAGLETEIENIKTEISEIERNAPVNNNKNGAKTERGETFKMETRIRDLPMRIRAFDALPKEERSRIVNTTEVKEFLNHIRSIGRSGTRAITGGELTIPVIFLDLIAENMYRYSKLIDRVRVRNVSGQARQTIAGTVPEAVWTEMCGALNELTLVFNQVTLDGFKVAGYIPVCNSLLDDSDIELAGYIVEALTEGIGLAVDKAILYGKGATSKMPLGIVTRLAQSSAPDGYPATAPEWVDLSSSNVITIDDELTGAAFWSALTVATGNAFTKYARGTQFWAMNSKTYALLKSKVITFTATGDIAANVYGVLPIITGDIVILEFMPDGDIVGGYGDLYLFAERGGMVIEQSREVQFIQDNTVFRGKMRADGMPIIANAFVAININGASPTTTMTFAGDTANDAALTALAVGTETLSPSFASDVLSYTITAANASDKIEATTAQAFAKAEISYNNQNVRNGGTVTWLKDDTAHPLTITVRNGNAVKVYTVMVTKSST